MYEAVPLAAEIILNVENANEGSSYEAGQAASAQAQIEREARDVVVTYVPWTISLLTHAGMVLLALFVVWSAFDYGDDEEPVIPIAQLSRTPRTPLTVQRTSRVRRAAETSRRVVTPVTTPTQSLLTTKIETPTIGVIGSAAANNPFATSLNTGTGTAQFFGVGGGNVKKLVYVVDASGSLIDTFPYVIRELKRSINRLDGRQQFTVIFFKGNTAIEVPKPRPALLRATHANKLMVTEWIDRDSHNIEPEGGSNPIKAVQAALEYRPDLIYILSDDITGSGQYEVTTKRLLSEIEKANVGRTRINTIQFIYPDSALQYGEEPTLKQISDQYGGRYKFVDANELGIAQPR